MQNVSQESLTDNPKIDKVNVQHDIGRSSTPHSTSNSSPAKSETETYSEHRRYMSDSSESEEDSVSEVESFMIEQDFEDDSTAKFLLNTDEDRTTVDPETQARLEALLQAAGIGQLAAKDSKHLADPEVLRRLTSSVSCALDEAAAALTRMRTDNNSRQPEKTSLVEACTGGDVRTVQKLLTEGGRSVHETSEEGESLLSLACSAGYFELAQVLLAMHANVEDRGIKGECTPLMEAASAGHLDIVRLLVAHGADVNAQSTTGNTPLMYGCAGGHTDVVKFLLEHGANVEDHNENGHTPLMEAASAGHVDLAKILLMHGAGINTHSNEFKESALTLACYKGHLDMVRFLLEAGADQEHKTDEMHTALMEASMDGHVEVARLLLDSGAQVNMPTDSFESPLTLAACGGHVDLAMLLIERGANIEEVNDEGYTPLMEAAREGHEEMVHLLLGQGANINAQTDETQETALTLACCGGFTDVADILLKGGANIELGASTPLMEAAQEGHLDLVKFLLQNGANVEAQTQTGDTALTYACENGHTDVADLLLQYGADLEHESEGGRTPLMKACRAGHLCTVQFLISKGANVRKQTTNNDHTPLSLACAGGHMSVVQLLLAQNADPTHKLKDNSTMLIEAAKGGHTNVVQLLLDYPHSIQSMVLNQHQEGATSATNLAMLPGQVDSRESPLPTGALLSNFPNESTNYFPLPTGGPVLQEVPDAVQILAREDVGEPSDLKQQITSSRSSDPQPVKICSKKSLTLTKSRSAGTVYDGNLTSAEAQQVRTQPLPLDFEEDVFSPSAAMEFLHKEDENSTLLDIIKNRKKNFSDDGTTQKQQILEELHKVERDLHGKQQQQQQQQQQQTQNHIFQYTIPPEQCSSIASNTLPHMLNIDIAMQQQQGLGSGMPGAMFHGHNLQVHNAFYTGATACIQPPNLKLAVGGDSGTFTTNQAQPAFYFTPLSSSVAVSLSTATTTNTTQPIKFQTVTSHTEVNQSTAISDRPKAKPVSKKEGKHVRKQPYPTSLTNLTSQSTQMFKKPVYVQQQQRKQSLENVINIQETLNVSGLDLDSFDQESLVLKEEAHENLLTASILQHFHNSSPSQLRAFVDSTQLNSNKTRLDYFNSGQEVKDSSDREKEYSSVEEVVHSLDTFASQEINEQTLSQHSLQVQPYPSALDESMIASLTAHQDLPTQTDLNRVEYFAVPTNGAQVPMHALYPYDYLAASGMPNKEQSGAIYQAGFQAGINLMQQQLACPSVSVSDTLTTATVVPAAVGTTQQFVTSSQQTNTISMQTQCNHAVTSSVQSLVHHCQVACNQLANQQPQIAQTHLQQQPQQQQPQIQPQPMQQQSHVQQQSSQLQQQQVTTQVQAATQTSQSAGVSNEVKKQVKVNENLKLKKGRVVRHQNQLNNFQQNQNFQVDQNSAITQYSNGANQQCVTAAAAAPSTSDIDAETESNHDTALTLACAGGHDELVELLLSRGADIEHRDKKGFTPLILAATAGHEKVVEVLLNHNADIEAQSERTKDTPLSLACSGGRYEVVEMLLNRNANKEHRNVSDYTPLSLAASGGYVNIIKLLLNHGAEINSRTGSKLGISPLMLAAMNGHTAAVKLLLDMGSDINAQIETNRNTALTLACFQGRHEVVSLLLDRKANVEHRAKTGLTPLMEAASGGYVEVGRVLLDKGADVNATPVPSSRDTALTIAADKGHVRFVELLLCRGAQVEVKNKKGNSPLWLAANGGHLAVVELLYNVNADIDSQDNRKVSCLMAAFRKGHVKVVKWMVHHVTQFPSDQEMIRYIATVSDKELLEKCQECVKLIRAAKETQAAKANKNASILLEELDKEKTREETKRLAAARRRERKKKKKLEKKEERRKLLEENKKNENYDDKDSKSAEGEDDKQDDEENIEPPNVEVVLRNVETGDKEEGDSGIDANSQGSCSSNDIKSKDKRKDKKKKKGASSKNNPLGSGTNRASSSKNQDIKESPTPEKGSDKFAENKSKSKESNIRKIIIFEATNKSPAERDDFEATGNETYVPTSKSKKTHSSDVEVSPPSVKHSTTSPKQPTKREEGWKEVVRKSSVQTISTTESGVKKVSVPLNAISRVIGRGGSNINAIRGATGAHIEVEKQCKGQGERIITIKGSSDATKQAHSLITTLIKDPDVDILQMLPKSTKAVNTTTTLWDKTQIGTKKVTGKVQPVISQTIAATPTSIQQKIVSTTATSSVVTTSKFIATSLTKPKVTVVKPVSSKSFTQIDKNIPMQNPLQTTSLRNSMQHSSAMPSRSTTKIITTSASQTFAAKLTETNTNPISVAVSYNTTTTTKTRTSLRVSPVNAAPVSPQASSSGSITSISQMSPKHNPRPTPTASAPPTMQHYQSPGRSPLHPPSGSQPPGAPLTIVQTDVPTSVMGRGRSSTPNITQNTTVHQPQPLATNEEINSGLTSHSEYSLFKEANQPMWRREHESQQKPVNFAAITGGGSSSQILIPPKFIDQEPPPQVDVSKAPGYRGGAVCSPVSSKTSSNSTTPPNSMSSGYSYHDQQQKPQHSIPPIGGNILTTRSQVSQNTNDMSSNNFYNDMFKTGPSSNMSQSGVMSLAKDNSHLMQSYHQSGQSNVMRNINFSQTQQQSSLPSISMSRLNPKAPDFSSSVYNSVPSKSQHQQQQQQQQQQVQQQQQQQQQSQLFNGYPMPGSNPIYSMSKGNADIGGYHRNNSGMGNMTLMQFQQPLTQQQTEMISGMATGLTLHNLARAAGSDILENGEISIMPNSPNMSPNLPPTAHSIHSDGHYMSDRKIPLPPQPIGTERATRKYYNPNLDTPPNWMMDNDNKNNRWPVNNIPDRFSINSRLVDRSYEEPPRMLDTFQPPIPLDNSHMYSNGSFLLPPQLGNVRSHDFVSVNNWDNSRQNIVDDKQPVWSQLSEWKQ